MELSTVAKLEETRTARADIVAALHDLERLTADKVRAYQEFERLMVEVEAQRARVLEMHECWR